MSVYTYKYPMPSITVDLVVFGVAGSELRVLAVRRKAEPFAGCWALPGGYLGIDEPFEVGARRELREETGVDLSGPIDFIGVFGTPGRDPRGRTVSIAHAAVVREPLPRARGRDDAAEADWLAVDQIQTLAFDHKDILSSAGAWLRAGVEDGPIPLELLPDKFRLPDLEAIYDVIFGMHTRAQAWLSSAIEGGLVRKAKRPAGVYEILERPARPVRYSAPFSAPAAPWAGTKVRIAYRG
jgi:8-oxo-dGTP diphosphatase